jgi:ClpP class serine protease
VNEEVEVVVSAGRLKNTAINALMQPMAMEVRALRALAQVAGGTALTDQVVSLDTGKKTTPSADAVCVVNVSGPLSKDPSIWQWLFGGTSYAGIKADIDEAVAAGAPVLLAINSPGGEVYGCGELAQYIRGLRAAGATVDAYISGQGDSAAYWIASACGRITINSSAEAGSIGVRCVMVDDSKMLDAVGVKVYDIVADQSPLKVADAGEPEDRARVKAQMTAFADVFIQAVADGRGASVSKVLSDFGRGDVLVGQAAVKAGLADEVGTLESTIAAMTAGKVAEMALPKNAAAAPTDPTAGTKCNECKADMGDEDDSYCSKCAKSASKESFAAAVCAIVGETDEAKVIGALTGLKAQAEKIAALEGDLKTLRAEKAAVEMKSELDKAVADGRVKKSGRAQLEKLYADHGKPAFDAALAVLTPAAPAATPASEETLEKAQPKKDPAQPDASGLSAEEMKVIKMTGGDPVKAAQQKARLNALLKSGAQNEEK